MNSNERRVEIFNILSNQKKASVNDLADKFCVTTMTIRRDLKQLEKQGIVSVYYGGATLNENGAIETSFTMRKPKEFNEKYFIAYEASKYIKDGDTIYIDGGSSCYYICNFLKNKNITVLTNSIRTVELLKECENVRIMLAPGEYSKIQEITTGFSTIDFLCKHHVNKAFMSTTGISVEEGLTMSDETEAQIKRKVLEIADTKILLVDHSKFGQVFFVNHGKIEDFDIIITDSKTKKEYIESIKEIGVNIDIVNIDKTNNK